jgi:DNA polymerase-3 subunit alpha
MDIPYSEVERIVKMVPPTLNITIAQALKDSPPMATAYETEPQTKELIDTAKKLEGLVRNAGVHAAGVVISPQPLTDLVPLHRTKNDEIVTAYDMKAVEKLGLLKMDFLGLTTLTIIDDALKLIEQTRSERLNLETLVLDDSVTYEKVFHTGLTSGVFQFESHGMRDVLALQTDDRRRPHCLERVVPSGADSGWHDRRLHRSQVGPQEDRVRIA